MSSETEAEADVSATPDAATEDIDNALVNVEPDTVDFRVEERDGKLLASIEDLDPWDENPRVAEDTDIERLKDHISDLGLYKPLVVSSDGRIVGGNMRYRALTEMGYEQAWIALVHPDDEATLIEYAMSDNDRIGRYEEGRMADLIRDYGSDLDVAKFKPDFYAPADLSQNLAAEMTPDELIELTSGSSDEGRDTPDDEPDATDGEHADTQQEAGDGDDPQPRSMENIGQDNQTAMVQVFMSQSEKDAFRDHVSELKKAYSVDTTSDVMQEAARREAERYRDGDALGPEVEQ